MENHPQPELHSPVHELIAARWSPYVFADKPVPLDDLRSLFEAARWAASAFNEQPWRYIAAIGDQSETYARILDCLVEANQAWAGRAPVLALGLARLNMERNDKPNATALHDLGLASANICLEAAARGLMVHQMSGILPDKAAELFEVPEGYQVVTGMAIGYAGEPEGELGERDQKRRPRRNVTEFVFGESFGEPFQF